MRHKDFFRGHVCLQVQKGIRCAQNGLCESTCTFGREVVNKAELIEALAARLGDRRTATQALDAVLAEIQAAVTKGDRVAITGFGAFEKRVRGARTARNPRTGEAVKVKKTSVPHVLSVVRRNVILAGTRALRVIVAGSYPCSPTRIVAS